jgi:hypothetical protein
MYGVVACAGLDVSRLPLFKYFGSKCRSSKHYPAPRYNTIYEPFCGHPSYSRRYGAGKQVLLFDLDPELIALIQWLIVADPAEIRALPHESLVVGQDIRMLGLRPEAADLVRRWQRTGNCSSWTVSNFNHIVAVDTSTGKPKWLEGPVPNGTVGKNTGMWHPRTREYLVQAVTEIRNWQAFCLDWRQIPIELAEPGTWFVDPPYQHIKNGYKVKADFDYGHLATWCKSLPGQVIVCEQEGADWLPFRPCCEVSGMRGKMRGVAGAKSQEVIWTND